MIQYERVNVIQRKMYRDEYRANFVIVRLVPVGAVAGAVVEQHLCRLIEYQAY